MAFQQSPIQNFIGKGLTFPIELSEGAGVISSGFDLIRSSILMIVSWPYGTRFMLGEFGSRVEELLEEPNDDILKQLVKTFIIDAITDWEKRIELIGTNIEKFDDATINIALSYRIVNSQAIDNFVFPFYRKLIY